MGYLGNQQYGPPPGPQPAAGQGFSPAAWPFGPGRPGAATAAGVLGRVTAGLTIAYALGFVVPALDGNASTDLWLLALGLPCAVGMLVGSGQVLRRRSARTLFAAAVAAVAVLVLALIVGVVELPPEELLGLSFDVVVALPLPVATALFARSRTVRDWLAAAR